MIERWRAFARRYGWRAYALPILAAITVVTLVFDLPAGADSHSRVHRHVAVEGDGPSEAAYTRGSSPRPVTIALADDATNCSENSYRLRLIVSINRQHLWACNGHKQVMQTPVTTGAMVHNRRTPTGSWRVEGRQRDRYLVGPGYRDYVHFWVPFNGDFGLHDAPWEKTGYGSQSYKTKGSHGCVHVPEAEMSWLYHWSKVGSTVVTVED